MTTICDHPGCTSPAVYGTADGWRCLAHMPQMTLEEHTAAAFLRLAGAERDDGHEEAAVAYETAADALGATCPHCGGDLLGVTPVDGRDVDTPPVEEIPLEPCPDGTHSWFSPVTGGPLVCRYCRTVYGPALHLADDTT